MTDRQTTDRQTTLWRNRESLVPERFRLESAVIKSGIFLRFCMFVRSSDESRLVSIQRNARNAITLRAFAATDACGGRKKSTQARNLRNERSERQHKYTTTATDAADPSDAMAKRQYSWCIIPSLRPFRWMETGLDC